jgi:polyhydroxyalkanoate synthase
MPSAKTPEKTLAQEQNNQAGKDIPSPAAFNQQMADILERLRPVMKEYVEKHSADEAPPIKADPMGMQPAIFSMWQNMFRNPQQMIDTQVEYWQNMFLLWHEMSKKFMGEETTPIVAPEKSDRRWRDPLWSENVAFDMLKQSYLLTSHCIQKSVRNVEGLDQKQRAKLDFYTRQFMDAVAPSNFAMTNPEVIRETISTKGQNLLKGLENLVDDLERGDGELSISKTNYDAYEVGKNLATTPGQVVFENDLMQLIQYEPTTKTVFKTPLLIVPPWINKYYILDLRPDNSYVKWATDQGYTVFVISWVNPDKSLAKKTFCSYMEEGLFAALDAMTLATGSKQANVIGYCIGGTLLTTALAYMAATGKMKDRIASATFLTTLIDFSESGDLGIFVDDAQLKAIDEKMEEKGYLEGEELRNTFSLLRANDLIWSFVINNYMMGKEPFPFDLLYWNDDSTNMPAAMHSFYLKNMYRDNLLCKAGGIKLEGVPLDVRDIKVPSYFLSTKDDHIAPWASTYEGMLLLGGDKTFVLSASGHVAGVVNPPASKKYHYWENKNIDDRYHPQEWLDKAKQHDGSWWTHWAKWVKEFSGEQVAARKPGSGKLKVIEPAPGRYVKRKVG